MKRIAIFAVLAILALTPLGMSLRVNATSATGPTFVWYFGYVGNSFYPQSELGITPAQMIMEAAQLSNAVGYSNLRFVSVVSEFAGQDVTPAMYPTIESYVSSLRSYASVVYGRIDLSDFNLKTTPSIYAKVAEYVQLGLNGIWLDGAIGYYDKVGGAKFNTMMQNIAELYPSLNFILNNAPANLGIVTPTGSWSSKAYISPSVTKGTYDMVSASTVASMNALYPGRVLVHFDAFGQVETEPMGLFADKSAAIEEGTVKAIASQYLLLYPVLGAWTYDGSPYRGTLYNSLPYGGYARDTVGSFVSVMTG